MQKPLRAKNTELLDWYDRHARTLPWRVGPAALRAGERPDPYRVWLSEIMLQQTTVPAVKSYYTDFLDRWPTVEDLAAAEDDAVLAAWAGLGYYARARNLLKCARMVASDHGGVFPAQRDQLQCLPGVGDYTSAAIAAIAFDQPETVMDGNVERVMARLFDCDDPLPRSKPRLKAFAQSLTPNERPGDYAQAVMDLGATVCTPRKPACGLCPWRDACRGRLSGRAEELPKKLPKQKKPVRLGTVFVGRRIDGAWLVEKRPDSGLLGGMLGWPGSPWDETQTLPDPPMRGEWKELKGEVRHTFTHFHLRLSVQRATLPMDREPKRGFFVPAETFDPSALPTVMRKVFDLANLSKRL